MKIWIDADAAPREVKELVFRASKRLEVEVILVANQSIWLPPNSRLISGVTVRDGANVADQYIAEKSDSGDVAITADIPLAAQLVEKGVFVLDPRGEVYDDRNIGSRLATRDWMDHARGAGMELSGPRPYSQRDRNEFASSLDRVLTRAIKTRDRKSTQQRPSGPDPASSPDSASNDPA
jgi:uncharacterized protein YaiI (UPF0178 family)